MGIEYEGDKERGNYKTGNSYIYLDLKLWHESCYILSNPNQHQCEFGDDIYTAWLLVKVGKQEASPRLTFFS